MTDSSTLLVIQWSLVAFFIIPPIECAFGVIGALCASLGYAQARGKFSRLIIQITTVGKEPELVQRTVNKLREYRLTMPHEIWVVIEPGSFIDYQHADEVIVVPANFKCRPVDKARALEYTRLLRKRRKLDQAHVKLLFVDDDTLPSQKYVYKAFHGDYDICQGVTVPNRWYAVGGWKHFLLSHLDDIRTRNCLIYCSCTQGILQYPLFVHGEGLCMTGRTEDIVTWDRPIVASDDLVFGMNAAHMGLKWGYFQASIQLVSPWSFRENLNQRWRWTWGNFDAIAHRDIMPLPAAIFKAFKYGLGFVSTIASTTGAILLITGVGKIPDQAVTVFHISLISWFASYGIAGWINAGGEANRDIRPKILRRWSFRVTQALAATLLTPITALAPIIVISYSVLRGRPSRFVMIKKSNSVMERTLPVAAPVGPQILTPSGPHRMTPSIPTSDSTSFSGVTSRGVTSRVTSVTRSRWVTRAETACGDVRERLPRFPP
jgi:hypothetical protein